MWYETPDAFRQALEARLRQRLQKTGEPLERMRKRLVFERCMVRLQKKSDSPWVVKGGFALDEVAQKLREDMDGEGDDGFVFVVSEGEEQLQIPGVQAFRFSVEARLAGRRFETIRVDVGVGDPLVLPLAELKGSDLLSFAEIPSPRIRTTSLAQHLAEKVHALTRPFKESISSRVKDLADIVLLMNLGLPDPPEVIRAVKEIFAARQSHEVPKRIAHPPATWAPSYGAMAQELDLKEQTLDSAIARVNDYWKTLFP